MTSRYIVRTLMLASGERLPVLVNRELGAPLFEPTVYTVSALRARNQASNSIDAALRSIMIFYLFLEHRHIELDQRLEEGKVLGLGEIDELVRFCRLPLKRLALLIDGMDEAVTMTRVVSIERHRMKQEATEDGEDVTSAASRVRYIRDYLRWLVESRVSKFSLGKQTTVLLESAGRRTIDALNARIPAARGRNTIGGREGIGQEAIDRVLAVTEPESADNPWHGDFARRRNQLIIHWLYELGIRRGELLGVAIADINFRENTVAILRKADSFADPRRKQPLTKTLDRILPISERLARMTSDYVIRVRSGNKAGLPHDFLFVAAGTGAPLSLIGLNKVFEVLRARCPDLPPELTPHVLRHTLNDLLSKRMDDLNIPEYEEQKLRSHLMGWIPTSRTAGIYTKRHIREKANNVLLEVQNSIVKAHKNEE